MYIRFWSQRLVCICVHIQPSKTNTGQFLTAEVGAEDSGFGGFLALILKLELEA